MTDCWCGEDCDDPDDCPAEPGECGQCQAVLGPDARCPYCDPGVWLDTPVEITRTAHPDYL